MIDPQHGIPLTTAITASAPGRGALVEALYRECLNLFKAQPTTTGTVTKQRSVFHADGKQRLIATVTDNESGLFIQMTGALNAAGVVSEGPFLSFGKKYLEESKPPMLHNTAVRLWR